jgi:methylmalonyl-CoA/ethylmalonyl-CoA epimerase
VSPKIDHIGIAVRSLESALETFRALGFECAGIEEVADQKTRVALLPAGEGRLELLEPTTEESPVGRFLARRGEGLHHICFAVGDVASEIGRLEAAGLRMVDRIPRVGAEGCRVAFIHPSSTGGVLVELSERPSKER